MSIPTFLQTHISLIQIDVALTLLYRYHLQMWAILIAVIVIIIVIIISEYQACYW